MVSDRAMMGLSPPGPSPGAFGQLGSQSEGDCAGKRNRAEL
jgi:hypothetical protein